MLIFFNKGGEKMNRLRELRKEKKLTLKEVSSQLEQNNLKISPDALAKYERGDREPKLETWQKLADFFRVSVPYLQGIEPDFQKVTEETKTIIAKILNNYYFGNVKDYELETSKNLKNAVDKYLKLKKVLKRPYSFYSKNEKEYKLTPRIKKYWLKHFSFLLDFKSLVGHINHISFNSKTDDREITLGEARWIIRAINREITETFKTEFGEYFEDVFLVDSEAKHSEFNQDLLTVKTSKELDNIFIEYKKYIDELHKKLKSDLKNNVPSKRNQEARKQALLALNIKKDFYSKTPEQQKEVEKNKKGWLLAFRELKEELNEDTSLIDEYLEKYGEQN